MPLANLLLMTLLLAEPTHADIVYATIGGQPRHVDLYLPANVEQPPLIVWVHGGAWRQGSRRDMPLARLVKEGFAVASVEYRLSPEAPFPAQAHDIKAAIRFLRSQANRYGYRADRIAIAGASAGAHLAALVGTTNGHAELEGAEGDRRDTSSDVQAIVSYYGMSNLTTILAQSTPHGLKVRVPALELLLGGQPEEKPELARLASPVFHVDRDDPPLLLLHGDQDPQAPVNQSLELAGRYEKAGARCRLVIVHGAKHGGGEFFDAERTALVATFLREALK